MEKRLKLEEEVRQLETLGELAIQNSRLKNENKRLREELDLAKQELRHLKYEMAGGLRR